MELVRGVPIDWFCARERLPLAARLRLFVQVCRAVQFAHQRLVVHCDLKPANILIDDAGNPHLLDFGIARLLGDAGDDPARDQGALVALTPGYASPEQLSGGVVTTALDVFALGVILCELGTECRPIDAPDQSASAREPLRGDLKCIAGKARHAEPAKRYASVQDFADDLEHFLTGHPVRARADSLAYRANKFVRRHRNVVAACAAACAALLFGWISARRGEQLAHAEAEHAHVEADSFQSLGDFLMDAFLPAQPAQDAAWQERARERILAHAEGVRRQSDDSAHMRANLLDMLGQVCMRLDLYADADRLVQEAMRLRAAAFGADTLEYTLSLRSAGQLKFQTGDYAEAERLLARALVLHRAAGMNPHADVAAVANDLAACWRNLGRDAEAEAIHREALTLRRRDGASTLPVAESLSRLAVLAHARQRDDEARNLWQEVVRIRRTPEVPARDLAEALHGYGVFLFDVRDLEHAATHLQEALALHHAGKVDDALALARAEYVLGRCHVRRRDIAQARAHLTAAARLFDALPNAPEGERARVREALAGLDR